MNNEPDYKVCNMCGSLVDNNNIFNIKGEDLCKSCIEKKLEQKQSVSPLGTFMCSLLPGVGQIYLGKREKGIFLLGSFIFSMLSTLISFMFANIFYVIQIIFICLFLPSIILACIIPIYSFFDANISRKFIENDKYVDGFVDKLAYKVLKKNNKKYLEEKIIDKRLQ